MWPLERMGFRIHLLRLMKEKEGERRERGGDSNGGEGEEKRDVK
jgi:hypothetical protein